MHDCMNVFGREEGGCRAWASMGVEGGVCCVVCAVCVCLLSEKSI